MHLDVVELRAFYYRTALGRSAQVALRDALAELIGSTRGKTLCGFGFAAPFLQPVMAEARRVICLMPGQQGVMPWPVSLPNASVLVHENQWPLATGSVDTIIVAHGLETCEQPGDLLDEIWRVTSPGGKAIFIVPNRAGAWARRETTPFGFGRPYSFGQLETQLKQHRFLPERHAAALYAPPSRRRFWLRSAAIWERIGRRLDLQLMAGALLVEASKQVYVPPQHGSPERVRRPLRVLEGLTRPVPKPATGRTRI
ncbi:MAG: methyltransferase domain-containing protein [Paracoccaceae bacterium]